ncbi:MAG: helix-turn-helix domain-containing protein [Hyphomicrobiales bacterium]
MSIQAVAWAISQRVGSPTGKVLLMCLANYANEKGECWPSQKTISQEAELGERATRDWLRKLEDHGFIERRRRNRGDGSRTSDLIILNLSKQSEPAQETLPAKSAGRLNQPASGSDPNGTSCRLGRHEVPGIEPSLKPLEEPSTGTGGFKNDLFDELWSQWPAENRPSKRIAAKHAFDRLLPSDQKLAVKFARQYRRSCEVQNEPALMIPYLKKNLFVELADGPSINPDGKFIITPERPEWGVWIDYFKTKYNNNASEHYEQLGQIVSANRLPPIIEGLAL